MLNVQSFRKHLAHILVFGMIVAILVPISASAAQLTGRKVTLGSSAASSTTTHRYDFTIPASANLGSMTFTYCTTASGACSAPAGLNVDGVTIDAQSGATGFSVDATTTTSSVVGITRSAASASGAVSYTFGSAVNPNTANQTFYIRIQTYNNANFTGAQDDGTVAASTASQIQLNITMPESLVFCVGTSITGTDCGTVSGSTINFSEASPTATRSGTSVMAASTNGQSGYAVTINGTTLTSGGNTITALAAQTASSTGTEQFGLNLRDNAAPDVGANPSGTGIGTYAANYGTVDQYRFVTGDTVASSTGSTNANAFTASYIVNVGGATEAGNYSATMTYICTATF